MSLNFVANRSFYEKTKTDAQRKGYRPSLWGGHVWESLHYMTLGYPERDPPAQVRQAAYDLMFSLQYLLPCIFCREHLADIYQNKYPLRREVFDSRESWGRYVVKIRDYVKRSHVLPPSSSFSPHHEFERDVVQRLGQRRWSPPPALSLVAPAFLAFLFLKR